MRVLSRSHTMPRVGGGQTRRRMSPRRRVAVLRTGPRCVLGCGNEGGAVMLYKLGRTLQVIGMILLPIAVAGNIVPDAPLDLRASLTLSAIGVCVFLLGYGLQQIGRERP